MELCFLIYLLPLKILNYKSTELNKMQRYTHSNIVNENEDKKVCLHLLKKKIKYA